MTSEEPRDALPDPGPDPVPDSIPDPVRRAYKPVSGRRDIDLKERSERTRLLLLSSFGAVMGFFLGVYLDRNGVGGPYIVPVMIVVVWAAGYFSTLIAMTAAGRLGARVYNPSGKSTPKAREYSLAESYIARGQVQAGVDAFEAAVIEEPTEPAPYVRLARIHRDALSDDARAAHWFRRALVEASPQPGLRRLIRQELLEAWEVRMGEPKRAVPFLAQIAEEEAGTEDGEWAARELNRIREDGE